MQQYSLHYTLQKICRGNADDITISTLFIFIFQELNYKIEPDYLISFLKINNKVDKRGGEYKLLHSLEHIQILNFNGNFL